MNREWKAVSKGKRNEEARYDDMRGQRENGKKKIKINTVRYAGG
jgi:hypothetical protein